MEQSVIFAHSTWVVIWTGNPFLQDLMSQLRNPPLFLPTNTSPPCFSHKVIIATLVWGLGQLIVGDAFDLDGRVPTCRPAAKHRDKAV